MAADVAALVVGLSAQLTNFEKDMKNAVKIADTNTRAIETRFSQMNSKIEQEFSSFIHRYAAAAGPLGSIASALGPVGLTIAAGLGVAATALSFLSTKTDEYIAKQRALKEASEVTGLSIGQLEALKSAAKAAGIEFDKAESGVTKMAVAIDQLREKGSGPLVDTLNKINPRLVDQVINAKNMAEAIDILSGVLDNVSDDFKKAGLAADLFGKRGVENLRLLKETLARGGLSIVPDITDEDKAFRERIIELDKQVKATEKSVNDTLGKMFSQQIRQNQLTFWQDTALGLRQAQDASAWFRGFLDQVISYVSQQPGIKSTNEELANLRMPGVGAGAPQPRGTTGVSGAAPSLLVDPYATKPIVFDVTAQMQSLQKATDEAIKSTNQSLDEQAATLNKDLIFLERWSGVLGDAASPQEQYAKRQRDITKAVIEYAPGSREAILLQQAGTRSLERLSAQQTIQANNVRERNLLLSEEEIVQNKLAQARLDAEKAGIRNIDLTKEEIVLRKQAKETIEQQAASLSKLPESVRASQEALNQFKQLDKFLVSSASNFENAFADIATGTKTTAEAFKSLADSIIKDLIRITLRLTVTGPLLSAIGGAFGAPAQGSANIFSSVFPSFGGNRQSGGSVAAGRGYIVGEHGTELFVPNNQGQIVPGQLSKGGGGGSEVIINNYVAADTETRQTQQQGPDGERIIIDIVKKAQARGDLDAGNRSRFGLRAAKVR